MNRISISRALVLLGSLILVGNFIAPANATLVSKFNPSKVNQVNLVKSPTVTTSYPASVQTVLSCLGGGTLVNATSCGSKTIQVGARYACLTGGSLSGAWCVSVGKAGAVKVLSPATVFPLYSTTPNPTPVSSSVYLCPQGGVLSGTVCVVTVSNGVARQV